MSLFRHKDPDGPPCRHMIGMLNGTADGSLRGFRRLYALAHAARCGPCGRFLHGLEALILRLRAAKRAEPSLETLDRLNMQVRAAREDRA